jgi:hypothetical protein
MLPRIQKAAIELSRVEENMRKVLAEEQNLCPHSKVIHSNWRSSEWVAPFKARRLCIDCGLEEEAKNFGWGNCDSDFNYLKTKGFHKIVSSDELYRSRFPKAKVHVE